MSDSNIYPSKVNEVSQQRNLIKIFITGGIILGDYFLFLNFQRIFNSLSITENFISISIAIFVIFIIFSIGLNQFVFSIVQLTGTWLRSTFIACMILISAHVLIIKVPAGFGFLEAVIASMAVFCGGLLTTWKYVGLWEDNFRPTEEDRIFVFNEHKKYRTPGGGHEISRLVFNFVFSLLGLIISSPVWLSICFAVWFEDPGPIFFVKNSVGKGGVNFRQFKFRTMVLNAENITGPIMAAEDDTRALWVGKLLRKTALDELPQLINILIGDMAIVGPRPQRTVLVLEYLQEMPEFAERHQVLPGLAGLAQVAGDYYLSPRQKLRFDRIYVKYASLGFDIKLILIAFLLVFYLRWLPNWDGKLPRNWLRFKL